MATDKLDKDFEARLSDAKKQKAEVNLDIREAYFFTKPRLSRIVSSGQPPSNSVETDADELCTTAGTEACEDFATELIAAYMPENQNWCRSERGVGVPAEVWAQVEAEAAKIDKEIFAALRASNFDEELASALIPEAAIGTFAVYIDETSGYDPFRCQHVPLRELEINVGPLGDVDDRFVVRMVRKRMLDALLPGIELPKSVAKKKDDSWIEVVWGYWRDWSVKNDEAWIHAIRVDKKIVHDDTYQGEGSCPLIVVRFAPDSLHAFGNGPAIDSLPDLRVHDAMVEGTQDRIDQAIRPAITYPDDGMLNFDGGIRAGTAYPRRAGATPGDKVEPLYFEGDPNLGLITAQEVARAIRRKHFSDYPDQVGKTPPTATQWLDEMIKSQRRIGTPGKKFFAEGPVQFFQRFKYLLARRGIIKPLKAKDGVPVSTRPYNPASRAQELQEVDTAIKFLSILQQFFPSLYALVVKSPETIETLKKKLGDDIVKLNEIGEAEALITANLPAILQSLGGGAGGGAPAAAGPAPAPGGP